MSRALKQTIIAIAFLGLVGYVAYRGLSRTEPVVERDEALRRYGCILDERAKECGIDFRHESPVLDAKLAHIMPLVAAMNASVSVVDFDGDGLLDLYVVTSKKGGQNRLYRNKGDGSFEDVAEAMGVADLNQPGTGFCTGAIWADIDNDGWPDLLVFKWGNPSRL
jgi:hypothetical protein